MRKQLLLCGTMLVLTAITALANPGVKLGWTDCSGDGGPIRKTFSCVSNTGAEVLVFSYEPSVETPQFNSAEVFLDVYFAGTTVPVWYWGCPGKTPVSISITPPATLETCVDIWGGAGLAALAAYNSPIYIQHGVITPGPANTVQVDAVGALPAGSEQDVMPGNEYYLFSIRFNREQTTGTGACSGCDTPAEFIAQGVWITQPTGPLQADYTQNQQSAAFQGGQTPTNSPTWGALKAMYR